MAQVTTRLRIVKSKKGFQVLLPSTNGKLLSSSEHFTQKPACWKNILAMHKFFGGKGSFLVQDDSLTTGPVVYEVADGFATEVNIKPKK